MNKKELEKMFDEKFNLWRIDIYKNWEAIWCKNQNEEVKQFIFENIIPEVIKNIIWQEGISTIDDIEDIAWARWYNTKRNDIKQKAKELFWIDL
jgi:hypothetical protein